uniref:F-box domain and ankyrin repeat protein n=1 Tax=Pithovirus LCPAC103 TaxID=2506588 RepID=A0A481Z3L5_9VIRU|nr:MAG: F-box domain and ankyrin repeat protein [Pithovirus LCPAC103]
MQLVEMEDVPDELLKIILSWLPQYLPVTKSVSRRWRSYSSELLNEIPALDTRTVYQEWIERDYLDLLKWAQANKFWMTQDMVSAAAFWGKLDILKWVLDLGLSDILIETYRKADEGGHFEVFKWLYQHTNFSTGKLDPLTICKFTMKYHHPKIFEWFREYPPEGLTDELYREAAYQGDLEDMKEMYEQELGILTKRVYTAAVHEGHIPIIEWLLELETDISTSHLIELAISGNQMETLKWLAQREFRMGPGITYGAAINGNLEMLIWLEQQLADRRAMWNSYRLTVHAALHGHLVIVKWLHSEDRIFKIHSDEIPLESNICRIAAEGDHFEVLKWLHQWGYPLTEACCTNAAAHGNLDMLQWLRANGCDWNLTRCIIVAAERGRLGILKWICEAQDKPFREILKKTRGRAKLDITERACHEAAIHGHIEILEYLNQYVEPKVSYAEVLLQGKLRTVSWLVETQRPAISEFHEQTTLVKFIDTGRAMRFIDWLYSNLPPVDS